MDDAEGQEKRKPSRSFVERAPEWVIMVALAFFAGLLGWLAWVTTPPISPSVTDEFSVLLGADTFAAGRLTNPTHAHWEFFETPHVIHVPSYQSKYQPGRAAFAALGIAVFGTPFAGQILLQMLMTAALYWGLRAVFPRAWALLAVLTALPFYGIYSYMALTLFGGLVSGTGGALLFGAALRLWNTPARPANLARLSVLMALGAVFLMFSRPYEGLAACLVPGGIILRRLFAQGYWRRPGFLLPFFLPAGLLMAGAFLFQGIYNHAVTKSWLTMPYQVYSEKYDLNDSMFIGAGLREDVVFQQDYLGRAFFLYLGPRLRPGYNPFSRFPSKIIDTGRVWMGPFLGLLALAGILTWSIPVRLALAHSLIGLVAVLISFAFQPHYSGPFYLGYLVLMVAGARWFLSLKLRWLPRVVRLSALLILIAVAVFRQISWQHESIPEPGGAPNVPMIRIEMEQNLAATPGDDLVFIRHTSMPQIWLFNSAEIDAQPVVWAGDMGPEKNRELLEYYPDRRPWLMKAGQGVQMTPYPEPNPNP